MSHAEAHGFVDDVTIEVESGAGGDGAATFRREKYQPMGGPNGGCGGKGGDVLLVAAPGIKTLIDLRYHPHWKAQRGSNGESGNRRGAKGEDRAIRIPVGAAVYDAQTDQLLADLNQADDTCVVVRGGRGGRGNVSFVSPTHRAANFAEKGEPGEKRLLRLELKLLADVGVIGFPNAGKSTLLSRVSAAKPKIAAYPFTTVVPSLGAVCVDSQTSFILADIPGIIEGAHEGRGLGHQFLRHVERTRVLIHLLDFASMEDRDPLQDFAVLNRELELFNEELAKKPQLVAANKMDLPEARLKLERLQSLFDSRGVSVIPISAVSGEGIQRLVAETVGLLKATEPAVSPEPRGGRRFFAPPPTKRPIHMDVSFDYGYVVSGDSVERLVAMTDLDNPEALAYMQRKLDRMGVTRMLKEAGIQDGDYVRIGRFVSNYVDEEKE